jgi:hypothetical protein
VKRVSRAAESKGHKVGKGPHHGRFSIVKKATGSRMPSGIPGCEFAFSLQEAEDWLAKIEKLGQVGWRNIRESSSDRL